MSDFYIRNIARNGSILADLSAVGDPEACIMTSPDGITWVERPKREIRWALSAFAANIPFTKGPRGKTIPDRISFGGGSK